MAIKDLMKATEADRYTADGRDELNKALKADVEDRVYKPHEISPKTGLEKQDDGSWAPPKKGGTPGAKAGEGTLKPSRKPDQKKHPLIKNPDVLGMTANGARKRMEAFGAQFVENKNGKDYFKTTSGDLVEVEYGDNKKVLSSTTYTGGEKPEQVYPTTAGHNIESYINKLHEEGWKNDGWERNSANGALGYFKKGDKTIRVMQNWNGTLGGVSEIKPKVESKSAASNNIQWNEQPNGRVWTGRSEGGKPLTVTWNREKNGDEWYGRSDSDVKYKTKEEAMNAPVEEPEWMKKINKEYASVIQKNPKLQRYLNQGKVTRLEVPGEGTYLGENAVARHRELTKENNENVRQGGKAKEYKLKSVDIDEQTARDLVENYMEDAAPRELTGDCKIRVRKA